jgi:hypothetical protein
MNDSTSKQWQTHLLEETGISLELLFFASVSPLVNFAVPKQ